MYDAAAKAKAKLLSLSQFESSEVEVPEDDTRERVVRRLDEFAKSRRMTFTWRETLRGINITRQEDLRPRQDWRFDKLAVDETRFYPCDEKDVPNARTAASNFANGRGWKLSVAKVPGGVNVTRRDPNWKADEVNPDPEFLAPKKLRFAIDTLEVGESLYVPLDQEFFANRIRSFCEYHGKRLEMKFSVTVRRHELPTHRGHNITRVE